MNNRLDKKDFGGWCEDYASEYFREKGWKVLDRNACFRESEIDLVLERNGILRFVEVKGRRNKNFGTVVEALTSKKICRLRKAVLLWRRKKKDLREVELWFFGLYLNESGRVEIEEFPIE